MPFLVYKTDMHHSYASRDIIGVCTSHESARAIVDAQVKKEGEKLNKEQRFNLVQLNQTQGYSGKGEFQIEFFKPDTLL